MAHNKGIDDNIRLGDLAPKMFRTAGLIGLVAIGVAAALGVGAHDQLSQFLHSYLVAYMWALAIGLGSLWWVTLQHLVNAKWSVAIRRVGELYAANMLLLAVLALPIIVPMIMGNSSLYIWVDLQRVHTDHLLAHKHGYLNLNFFLIRVVVYFGFWTLLARWFLGRSLKQDESGNPEFLKKMNAVAAPGMLALALTLTFAAFDFLMSVDPYWFSTIFGVYYFASCVLSAHATFVLTLMWLQSKGRLRNSISVDHYHDLGKMLFAFTVFWAYIGFSQFMLIWYANLPEETAWFKARFAGPWGNVAWALLVCHFVLPFFGLLSRHVKRHRKGLAFFAVWMLLAVYLDLYWLVMPVLGERIPFGAIDVLCLVGLASLVIAGAAFNARSVDLMPTKDPRLAKSLAFENY